MNELRILSFVNHVAPNPTVHESLARAAEWGVDVVVAQGNGMDFGPYWLGSGQQFNTLNFKENVRPYLHFCKQNRVPFIFSCGIAGGRPHVEECLQRIDEISREDHLDLRLAVIHSELDQAQLRRRLENGARARRLVETPYLAEWLRPEDVDEAVRIVAQMGPEPIIEALDLGVDGVITGRALDVGLYLAMPLKLGFRHAISAHLAKVLECGGVALDPSDPGELSYGVLQADSFSVRAVNPAYRCSVQSIASHSFYERRDPFREENPGGYLDLSEARYKEEDPGVVRSWGARWVHQPYSLKLEGARRVGFRTINVAGIRDPFMIGQIDSICERIKADIRTAPRFAHLQEGKDYQISFTLYGKNAVMGDLEPMKGIQPHEIGVVIDVVASTRDLAQNIGYFAYIGLWIKPYPGRKTTAGNVAERFAPPVIDVGDAFTFNVWHRLEIDDPLELFPIEVRTYPMAGGTA